MSPGTEWDIHAVHRDQWLLWNRPEMVKPRDNKHVPVLMSDDVDVNKVEGINMLPYSNNQISDSTNKYQVVIKVIQVPNKKKLDPSND